MSGIDTLEDRGRGITQATKQGLVESLVDHRMKPNCIFLCTVTIGNNSAMTLQTIHINIEYSESWWEEEKRIQLFSLKL